MRRGGVIALGAAGHVLNPSAQRVGASTLDAVALFYLAFPSFFYLCGWVAPAYGIPAALALAACLVALPRDGFVAIRGFRLAATVIALAFAAVWTVLGGLGHFVYANLDWITRDAVLLDLIRMPWPVVYDASSAHPALLLRAPIGFYLPAAATGKLFGLRAAECALLLWTASGVFLTFMLLQRDRPRVPQLLVRLAVFVLFSGMDIVGTIAHYNPRGIGEHLEWWAFIFQYSSHTTQLFWVPNHALPGWIAIAWLLGYQGKRLPIASAIVMVALTPLWSPLTAIGLAPIFGVAIIAELVRDPGRRSVATVLDPRAVVVALICGALVYPYLLIGSGTVGYGMSSDIRWVGEDFFLRYIEFIVFEFALLAAVLLWRYRFEPLLLCAIAALLLLPLYRIGGANDLAMRASIPALALLAIRLGEWLSAPRLKAGEITARCLAIVLLAIGAITPFMEVARVFVEPRWDMDTEHSLVDVTRGYAPHYLTPRDQPWLDRFLRPLSITSER